MSNYRFIMHCLDDNGQWKAGTGKGVCVPLTGIKTLYGAVKRISKYNLNNGLPCEIEDITGGTIYPKEYMAWDCHDYA